MIWASGIGGLETFFQAIKSYVLGDGTPRFSPFFIPKMIADIAAGVNFNKIWFQGTKLCDCISMCFIHKCNN